ncbi:hypothetical protein BCR44DRAFT_23701 [Catenaria anguillulae PL171]|uniref:Uncharacterized protein n=1 Tax=Catenaria anguillulae PL171 TaxID=765915 RepID=A0A1Y2HUT2_9FUNG|nr:hypothetical protein BCR44DRAFT_23701 [Catenaria anguillulae PL171]
MATQAPSRPWTSSNKSGVICSCCRDLNEHSPSCHQGSTHPSTLDHDYSVVADPTVPVYHRHHHQVSIRHPDRIHDRYMSSHRHPAPRRPSRSDPSSHDCCNHAGVDARTQHGPAPLVYDDWHALAAEREPQSSGACLHHHGHFAGAYGPSPTCPDYSNLLSPCSGTDCMEGSSQQGLQPFQQPISGPPPVQVERLQGFKSSSSGCSSSLGPQSLAINAGQSTPNLHARRLNSAVATGSTTSPPRNLPRIRVAQPSANHASAMRAFSKAPASPPAQLEHQRPHWCNECSAFHQLDVSRFDPSPISQAHVTATQSAPCSTEPHIPEMEQTHVCHDDHVFHQHVPSGPVPQPHSVSRSLPPSSMVDTAPLETPALTSLRLKPSVHFLEHDPPHVHAQLSSTGLGKPDNGPAFTNSQSKTDAESAAIAANLAATQALEAASDLHATVVRLQGLLLDARTEAKKWRKAARALEKEVKKAQDTVVVLSKCSSCEKKDTAVDAGVQCVETTTADALTQTGEVDEDRWRPCGVQVGSPATSLVVAETQTDDVKCAATAAPPICESSGTQTVESALMVPFGASLFETQHRPIWSVQQQYHHYPHTHSIASRSLLPTSSSVPTPSSPVSRSNTPPVPLSLSSPALFDSESSMSLSSTASSYVAPRLAPFCDPSTIHAADAACMLPTPESSLVLPARQCAGQHNQITTDSRYLDIPRTHAGGATATALFAHSFPAPPSNLFQSACRQGTDTISNADPMPQLLQSVGEYCWSHSQLHAAHHPHPPMPHSHPSPPTSSLASSSSSSDWDAVASPRSTSPVDVTPALSAMPTAAGALEGDGGVISRRESPAPCTYPPSPELSPLVSQVGDAGGGKLRWNVDGPPQGSSASAAGSDEGVVQISDSCARVDARQSAAGAVVSGGDMDGGDLGAGGKNAAFAVFMLNVLLVAKAVVGTGVCSIR